MRNTRLNMTDNTTTPMIPMFLALGLGSSAHVFDRMVDDKVSVCTFNSSCSFAMVSMIIDMFVGWHEQGQYSFGLPVDTKLVVFSPMSTSAVIVGSVVVHVIRSGDVDKAGEVTVGDGAVVAGEVTVVNGTVVVDRNCDSEQNDNFILFKFAFFIYICNIYIYNSSLSYPIY